MVIMMAVIMDSAGAHPASYPMGTKGYFHGALS